MHLSLSIVHSSSVRKNNVLIVRNSPKDITLSLSIGVAAVQAMSHTVGDFSHLIISSPFAGGLPA